MSETELTHTNPTRQRGRTLPNAPARSKSADRPPSLARRVRVGIMLLAFGVLTLPTTRASEDTAESPANSPPAAVTPTSATPDKNNESPKKPAAPNLPPEKYRDVDDAAKLMVWLVVSCGLGGLLLLGVIVLGAKRMRRLTRSQMLKSKYDELEFLRLKHRREADGFAAPEPPKTEIR